MFLLFSWMATAQPVPPDAREVAWATWQQEHAPEWTKRQTSAAAKRLDREAFFAGEKPFGQAFPDLVDARLSSMAVVQGRLEALQRAATAREAERLNALTFGTPERDGPARTLRADALATEEAAEVPLRRLLTRVEAHLVHAPALRDDTLSETFEALQSVLDAPLPEDPEERRAALAASAQADVDLAAWRQLQRSALVAGLTDTQILLPDDLARLTSDAPNAMQAAARLRSALPWLENADAVRRALGEFAKGPALAQAQQELAEAQAELAGPAVAVPEEEAQAALEQAAATVAHLTATLDALSETDPRRSWMPVRVETAQVRLETAQKHLHHVVRSNEEEENAAARARAEAEAAAAAAVGDDQKAEAALLTAAADARDRLVALNDRVAALKLDADALRKSREEEIARYAALLERAEQSSSLVRVPDLDSDYASLRTELIKLEESDKALGTGVVDATTEVEAIDARILADRARIRRAPQGDAAFEEKMETWKRSLEREILAAESVLAAAGREYTDHMAHIRALAEKRRLLRSHANWQEQDIDQATSFHEVKLELGILGPSMGTLITNRAYQIWAFPARLISNGKLMADIGAATIWLLVLLAAWNWGRGKSAVLAARISMQLRRFRADLRPMDLHRLKGPLTSAIQAGIDLSLGYLMMGRISELSGEIGFLVQCWLLQALFRFLLALFDLAVVKSPEFRPSVVALAPEAFDRVRYSARVAFIWMIAKGFVYHICWTIFGMDAFTNLLMLLFNVLGLGLAVVIAHNLYPMLLERIQSRNQESRLVATLSRKAPWFLQAPVALALLSFFGVTIASDLWHFAIAHDKTGIAKLFNVVSRFQMDEVERLEPPDPETREKLCGSELGQMVHVDRPEVDEEIIEAIAEWRKDSRRGLVALVGDRGSGKRTETRRFERHVARDELPLRRFRMRKVVLTPIALFEVIAKLAEIEPSDDAEVMVARLKEADRAVLVLEQAHRSFSRSVGGFDAIQQLLYLMNATSDHHFWLVTVHGPAWNYLAAIPTLIDVGVFRSVIKLAPFTATQLRELCESRMKASERQLDYSSLMRNNLLGADPKVELERATNTFYRLLAECSEGNPRVAMRLFAESLEKIDDHRIKVHTTKALATDVATDLSIQAMFTLVALRQEDAMELWEVAEVTNVPVHIARNLLRDLQSRGLVEQESEQLYIPIHMLPMVTRTLRRRHLMHLGT